MPTIPLTLHAPAVVDDSWEIELTVCDDLVGVFVYDDNEGRTEVWVYNWEEGKLIFSVFSESDKDKLLPDHFDFLSRDVVLFTAFGHDTNTLIAVDIRHTISPRSRFQDLFIVSKSVSLDLPRLSGGTVYQLSTIACSSMRSSICGEGIFGSRHANTLIVLMLELTDQHGAEHSYDLVVSPAFILSRLEDVSRYGAGPWPSGPARLRMLTWPDWRTHTRIFRTLSVPEVPVHGSRYLTAKALPDGKYRLVLRDFDTLSALRLDKAAGDADIHEGIEGVEDEDKLWDQEAWVGAPYREVESDIIVEDEDRVFLAEDGIVVARHRDHLVNVDSTKLEIYSI
ncbi:hypothetical protein PsYK624_141770 [Phanerochaete sordida]|uniref:Uncharacterized protein n=1 Tax=Phanerochaete sordida TaxID=48140 RepID=A0A9P3GM95_9APHY|nr:hypothetical protein PsYK624_141770 [Phanerochaete sordida]